MKFLGRVILISLYPVAYVPTVHNLVQTRPVMLLREEIHIANVLLIIT